MNSTQKLIDEIVSSTHVYVSADDWNDFHLAVTKALEGKVIVDAEPTPEMIEAAVDCFTKEPHRGVKYLMVASFKAMLNSTEGLSDE